MIPIHNLTANNYTLRSGDGLIWVEFTKLSPFPRGIKEPPYNFPSFINHTANDYFENATNLRKVESSVFYAMNSAKKDAENAKKTVSYMSWATGIAILFTAIGIAIAGITLVTNVITPTIGLVDSQKEKSISNTNKIKKLEEKIKKLESKVKKDEKNSN